MSIKNSIWMLRTSTNLTTARLIQQFFSKRICLRALRMLRFRLQSCLMRLKQSPLALCKAKIQTTFGMMEKTLYIFGM